MLHNSNFSKVCEGWHPSQYLCFPVNVHQSCTKIGLSITGKRRSCSQCWKLPKPVGKIWPDGRKCLSYRGRVQPFLNKKWNFISELKQVLPNDIQEFYQPFRIVWRKRSMTKLKEDNNLVQKSPPTPHDVAGPMMISYWRALESTREKNNTSGIHQRQRSEFPQMGKVITEKTVIEREIR